MKITYDEAKRTKTLEERGLDFEDAVSVFHSAAYTIEDTRHAYGEIRHVTYGFLADRMVAAVWTPRDNGRRILSMRYAHEKEYRLIAFRMG